MATVAQTHPSELWGLGDEIGSFFQKLGIPGQLGQFFNLMPEVDLDRIREVAQHVWGINGDSKTGTGYTDWHVGTVAGDLDAMASKLRDIVGNTPDWSGDAADRFRGKLNSDATLFEKARDAAAEVGQSLLDFANDVDSQVADWVGLCTGLVGAVAGCIVGLIFAAPTLGGSEVVLTVAGLLVGFIVGVVFAFAGVLVPKAVMGFLEIRQLAGETPPASKPPTW